MNPADIEPELSLAMNGRATVAQSGTGPNSSPPSIELASSPAAADSARPASAPPAPAAATVTFAARPVASPKGGRRHMGLATRLAILTALLAVCLVLTATEVALRLSQGSRLDDFREESVALASTLATFLMRIAPTGNPEQVQQGLAGWSRHRITETRADVYERRGRLLVPIASSDSALSGSPNDA